ncbi:MAG: ATP-binding protein [Alphaproteobacteria bacterium]|nr:ATP-binding protein [Alphaproteobacteria bacterium]
MYIKRTIEKSIKESSDFFPVVLITGPRQVGKTTVFQNCEKKKRTYVSLDTLDNRRLAQTDPRDFLERYPAPVLIDEIQYAPELFPYIKSIVDEDKKSGAYWITGSQQFELMKNVTESLAGRVGILSLQGLSQTEKNGTPKQPPFLPTTEYLSVKSKNEKKISVQKIFKTIWKGSYPKLFTDKDNRWELFYGAYVKTYIERDVRQLKTVQNELDFMKFMTALAARTGQLLNYSDLAKDVGVAVNTIRAWISVLQTSGLIYLLQPYSNNLTNRVIKTPKVYFMDTGIACYLTKWNSPETLEAGAFAGAIFETYVVSEIIKSYWHNGKEPAVYFYRDHDAKEIDVILEENGKLYPLEIKKKSNPDKSDVAVFTTLKRFGKEAGSGGVICSAPTYLPLGENAFIIPVGYL